MLLTINYLKYVGRNYVVKSFLYIFFYSIHLFLVFKIFHLIFLINQINILMHHINFLFFYHHQINILQMYHLIFQQPFICYLFYM